MSNVFEDGLEKYFTQTQLTKIKQTSLLICGAGGLGSNICHALVRCGFLNFTVIDCDEVDASNLNRQFYFPNQIGLAKVDALKENLLKINPDLNIKSIKKRLEKDDVLKYCENHDIIVEAFDSVKSKTDLIFEALKTKKPVVCASGMAGFGNSDLIVTKKLGDNFYLVGDETSDIKNAPPLCPRVMVVAAKQADIILNLVLDNYKMILNKGDFH